MPDDGYGVGASLLRKEDERYLHGRGQFVSDIKLPDTMDVAFVRSPHAHARIKSISIPPEARRRVFTAADLPRVKPIRVVSHSTGAKSPPWPPLATDKVRYVGEAIAACIAPSRGEAEDLANAVSVDFEILEAVVDAPRDMRGSRHPVHEHWGDNLYVERDLQGGKCDIRHEGVTHAARTTRITTRTPQQSVTPVFTRGRDAAAISENPNSAVMLITRESKVLSLPELLGTTRQRSESGLRKVTQLSLFQSRPQLNA